MTLSECPAWFYAGTLHLEPMWCYFHGVLGDLKTVLGEWVCKEFLPGKAWTSFFLPFPLGSWHNAVYRWSRAKRKGMNIFFPSVSSWLLISDRLRCVTQPSHPAVPVPHSWVTFQVPDRLQRQDWRQNVEASESSSALENPFFLPEATGTFLLPTTIKSQEWVWFIPPSPRPSLLSLEMESEIILKR